MQRGLKEGGNHSRVMFLKHKSDHITYMLSSYYHYFIYIYIHIQEDILKRNPLNWVSNMEYFFSRKGKNSKAIFST